MSKSNLDLEEIIFQSPRVVWSPTWEVQNTQEYTGFTWQELLTYFYASFHSKTNLSSQNILKAKNIISVLCVISIAENDASLKGMLMFYYAVTVSKLRIHDDLRSNVVLLEIKKNEKCLYPEFQSHVTILVTSRNF